LKRAIAAMFIVVLTVLGGPGCAAWDSTHSMLKEVGYGAGSVFGTLVYASFKASFCILGAIGSACTLPLGTEMAEKVVGASCQGTGGYVGDHARPGQGPGGRQVCGLRAARPRS